MVGSAATWSAEMKETSATVGSPTKPQKTIPEQGDHAADDVEGADTPHAVAGS